MTDRRFTPRALGEIAIRCHDLAAMTAFYRDMIGLPVLAERDGIVFFKIADGYAGHTAVLALFGIGAGTQPPPPTTPGPPVAGAASSLHHLALSLPLGEQAAVVDWYETNGIDYTIQEFPWIGWRGIFTKDPEGNTVELVAFDPDVFEEREAR